MKVRRISTDFLKKLLKKSKTCDKICVTVVFLRQGGKGNVKKI